MPDICRHFGNYIRPFREGQNILRAQYLSIKSITKITNEYVLVQASCIQCSVPTSVPHNLEVRLLLQEDKTDITGTCSCKEGIEGACKYFAALLMLLERSNEEELSCTDQKCKWKISRKFIVKAITRETNKNIKSSSNQYESVAKLVEEEIIVLHY
ncbi:hypothetical protein PGB90_005267 [Kerria lacca]